jgi:hypothetical protein
MQDSAAQAHTRSTGKLGSHGVLMVHKIYSAKWISVLRPEYDTKLPEGRDGIGHQPFTARFVYGRSVSVRYHHFQTSLLCSDSGSESSRPAANYENVGALRHRCARYSQNLAIWCLGLAFKDALLQSKDAFRRPAL